MNSSIPQFGVITLLPELFAPFIEYGVIGRAFKHQKANIQFWNPRDFTQDVHHTVDDKPFGGGAGMVMMIEPLLAAINMAKEKLPDTKVIYLTPAGKPFAAKDAQDLAAESDKRPLIFLCGRYEGIDQRLIDHVVDREISVGDYVLSGGELPTMTVIDAIMREIPGVLGNHISAETDSFADGLLDYPHYTRPAKHALGNVPEVLLSGDHQKIAKYRRDQQLKITAAKRPDLLETIEHTGKTRDSKK